MHASSARLSYLRNLLHRLGMAARNAPYGAPDGPATGTHTVTALSRWSILNKQLPRMSVASLQRRP